LSKGAFDVKVEEEREARAHREPWQESTLSVWAVVGISAGAKFLGYL
jgi:hypothetical protein